MIHKHGPIVKMQTCPTEEEILDNELPVRKDNAILMRCGACKSSSVSSMNAAGQASQSLCWLTPLQDAHSSCVKLEVTGLRHVFLDPTGSRRMIQEAVYECTKAVAILLFKQKSPA